MIWSPGKPETTGDYRINVPAAIWENHPQGLAVEFRGKGVA
jgi:hypothetical protein